MHLLSRAAPGSAERAGARRKRAGRAWCAGTSGGLPGERCGMLTYSGHVFFSQVLYHRLRSGLARNIAARRGAARLLPRGAEAQVGGGAQLQHARARAQVKLARLAPRLRAPRRAPLGAWPAPTWAVQGGQADCMMPALCAEAGAALACSPAHGALRAIACRQAGPRLVAPAPRGGRAPGLQGGARRARTRAPKSATTAPCVSQ